MGIICKAFYNFDILLILIYYLAKWISYARDIIH
jgi:hypothetical protein